MVMRRVSWSIGCAALIVAAAWWSLALASSAGISVADARSMPSLDAPGGLGLGLDLSARTRLLLQCQNAIAGSYSVGGAPADTVALCGKLVEKMLQDTPVFGQAEFVAAAAAAAAGRWAEARTHLARSRALAPGEAWLARNRADLLLRQSQHWSQSDMELLQADLALLLESRSGLNWVAANYVGKDALRPAVNRVLPAASPQQQARFLDAVTQIVGE